MDSYAKMCELYLPSTKKEWYSTLNDENVSLSKITFAQYIGAQYIGAKYIGILNVKIYNNIIIYT